MNTLKTTTSNTNVKKLIITTFVVGLLVIACTFLCACSGNENINNSKIDVNTDNLELVKNGKLTVATCSDYPPFESFVSVEPWGIDVDIAYQLANDLDLMLMFKNMDFESIGNTIENHDADLSLAGITVTEPRKNKVNFSTPYFEDKKCIVVKNDSNISSENVDNALNSSGNTLVCQLGSTYEQYARANFSNINIITKSYNEECLNALKDNEANMFLVSETYANDKTGNDFKIVKTFDDVDYYAAAFNKETPNLENAVNIVLEKRTQDGTIANIIKKNFARQ